MTSGLCGGADLRRRAEEDVVLPGEADELAARRRGSGCGKLYRARSRLYRNEIVQVNMRLKALAEIYTMHSFARL